MKIEVHHHDRDSGSLVHVANVEYECAIPEDALDYAWEHTQNIDGSWSRGHIIVGHNGEPFVNRDYDANVERLVPLPVHDGRQYGLRSSSVGDVFVIGDFAWKVAGMGFEPCEVPA